MDYNKMAQQLGSYATDYGVNPKTGMAKVKDPNKVGFFDRMQAGTGGAGQFLGGMFGGGMPWGNDPQAAVQWAQGLKGQGLGIGQQFAPGQQFPPPGLAQQAGYNPVVPPGAPQGVPAQGFAQAQGLGQGVGNDPMGMRTRLMQGFKS